MAAFDYNILITGDCTNNSTGSITVELSGGTPPYSVEFISPYVDSYTDILDSVTIQNLGADVYYLRVNDSTLPVNEEFLINVPVSNGVCINILSTQNTTCGLDNGNVIINSSSFYSSINYYLYNTLDNLISSGVTSLDDYEIGPLSADTYYIVGSDLGGCTGRTSNFIIEDSSPLDYGFYVVSNTSCEGCGSEGIGKVYITGLTGTPPYTYLWNNGFTGNSITGLTSGLYSVQVTDFYGCQLNKSVEVFDVSPLGFGVFTITNPSCFDSDGVINLTVSGGTGPYYYSASTGDVLISYSQTFSLSGLSPGQYSFLVTDSALCKIQVSTILSSPGGMYSVTVSGKNSTCSIDDGEITIVSEGGSSPYKYTIIYPDSSIYNFINNSSTYTFENLFGGTYTVGVEDSSGCSYLEEITVITNDKYTLDIDVTGTTCNLNNGYIEVKCSTGYTLPLTYRLDNGESFVDTSFTSVTFNNVSSGQHTIQVFDSSGCIQQNQVYVPSSTPLIFSLYGTSCNGGNDGTITAYITSGSRPYLFNWSDNVPGNPQTIRLTGLSADTYSLSITDGNGCTLEKSIIIDCNATYNSGTSGISYQAYFMGGGEFRLETSTKSGLLQMLNEGYYDLTSGNTSCSLNSAEFIANVVVDPSGYTNSNSFFTTTQLNVVPSDNLWFNTIKALLLTVPGIGSVTIDPINNIITIKTISGDNRLVGQQIVINLSINYDITC